MLRISEYQAAKTEQIIRVFPRKTRATPTDGLAYFGPPNRPAEADEVHVSVTFTYDEHLTEQWKAVAAVKVGGVAYGGRSEEFMPGRYVNRSHHEQIQNLRRTAGGESGLRVNKRERIHRR